MSPAAQKTNRIDNDGGTGTTPTPSPLPRNQRITVNSIKGRRLRRSLLITASVCLVIAGGLWLSIEGPPRWKLRRAIQHAEQVLASNTSPANRQWGSFVSIEGSGYEVVREMWDPRNVNGHVIARRVAVFENARIPLVLEVTKMGMNADFVGTMRQATSDDVETYVRSEVQVPRTGPLLFCRLSTPGYRLPKAR